MPIRLNHTIVRARDKRASAAFLTEILGLPPATPYGPFLVVQVDNDVSLDFADDHVPAHPQHYAFLVDESDFDDIFGRIKACTTGPTRSGDGRASSTLTTAAVACTGTIRTGTSSRSSPGRTAVVQTPETPDNLAHYTDFPHVQAASSGSRPSRT